MSFLLYIVVFNINCLYIYFVIEILNSQDGKRICDQVDVCNLSLVRLLNANDLLMMFLRKLQRNKC